MSRLKDWFKSFYFRYLSRPKCERPLYQHIHTARPVRLVELGMGNGERSRRLIEFAHHCQPEAALKFFGVDWFEARADAPEGWSLKSAHQELKGRGAQVRLWPGDPFSALSRQANALGDTDLIVISADQDPESLAKAWLYLPRMLHEKTAVFVEERTEDEGEIESRFVRLSPQELEKLSGQQAGHIRRAA